jgi:hypothetical protein
LCLLSIAMEDYEGREPIRCRLTRGCFWIVGGKGWGNGWLCLLGSFSRVAIITQRCLGLSWLELLFGCCDDWYFLKLLMGFHLGQLHIHGLRHRLHIELLFCLWGWFSRLLQSCIWYIIPSYPMVWLRWWLGMQLQLLIVWL